MNTDGYLTDFSKSGTEPTNASFHLNPQSPGQLHRVGGSFPGIDSPYALPVGPNANGQPADMNTVWGLGSQSSMLGNPGV